MVEIVFPRNFPSTNYLLRNGTPRNIHGSNIAKAAEIEACE